ncbi:alpha/beta-hydrolase [Aspergillus campestris IBT 28561]|uniref:Alpha/beta-hydrolase n=1 Tax=Aspergillus campestris (strain IBT 28561) TaxID=1392248 RepID=A0A2I1D4Z0_ASPC2|nr:alpha/beta-hydrolase [Aspergillus campestris IBT 28561]PKY04930.1 alpha/beta-hydrolase [Aspergillus campestris IBT 28561]
MVLFQNKIIYMPSIPPLSKFETAGDYATECRPVRWTEDSLVTKDRVHISLLLGEMPDEATKTPPEEVEHVVVLYFQGNASSLPPRLPFLSQALKKAKQPPSSPHRKITIVGVSYRGYWTSSGRPSQRGIEIDAKAALSWALHKYAHLPRVKIVLWGQSIGAGVATGLAAEYRANPSEFATDDLRIPISGLVLETPFTCMEDLLLAFYPQKWLPYHYLGPFLRSHWDSVRAVERIAGVGLDGEMDAQDGPTPQILLLEGEKDEVVPAGNAEILERRCREVKLDVQRKVIPRALHSTVIMDTTGQRAVADFLKTI